MLFGVVVDELVARWAQQHQVIDVVNVFRPVENISARSLFAEGHDMSHLGEDPAFMGQVMLDQVVRAAVELASATGKDKKLKLYVRFNPSGDLFYRRRERFNFRRRLRLFTCRFSCHKIVELLVHLLNTAVSKVSDIFLSGHAIFEVLGR